MSINTAININRSVGCDQCANRAECQKLHPLLALLVFMHGGECDAKEVVE